MSNSKRYPGLSSNTAAHEQSKLASMPWEQITDQMRQACKDCPGQVTAECDRCPIYGLVLDALRVSVLSQSERNKARVDADIAALRVGQEPYPGDTSNAGSPVPDTGPMGRYKAQVTGH